MKLKNIDILDFNFRSDYKQVLTAKDDENLFEACITENFIEIGKQQFTGAESYQEIK